MNQTASLKGLLFTDTPKQNDPKITGYRIVDMELLGDAIEMLCCPSCKQNDIHFHENFLQKKGFSSVFTKSTVELFIPCG